MTPGKRLLDERGRPVERPGRFGELHIPDGAVVRFAGGLQAETPRSVRTWEEDSRERAQPQADANTSINTETDR